MNKKTSHLVIISLLFVVLLIFPVSAFDNQTDMYCGGDLEARFVCFGDTTLGLPQETKGGALFDSGKPTFLFYSCFCFVILILLLLLLLLLKRKKNENK